VSPCWDIQLVMDPVTVRLHRIGSQEQLLRGLDRRGDVGLVCTLDVGAAKDGGAELARQALRADDQNPEHEGESSRDCPKVQPRSATM